MDEIEAGLAALINRINATKEEKEHLAGDLVGREADLLARMGEMAAPLISDIGVSLLQTGRQDPEGHIFKPLYYREKMIVLGKTDPIPYRPDDASKKVADQYCVLTEKGEFAELMYSTDGQTVDSYFCPLAPTEAVEIYGYDLMLMLYRALQEYLTGEEEMVEALGRTLALLKEGTKSK